MFVLFEGTGKGRDKWDCRWYKHTGIFRLGLYYFAVHIGFKYDVDEIVAVKLLAERRKLDEDFERAANCGYSGTC